MSSRACFLCWALAATAVAGAIKAQTKDEGARRNQLIVTPAGPSDGGDFGPNTPGTRTSGLQEAFDAAKRLGKDVYLSGGSWTADKTKPVVYFLQTTLNIPWMQNFRLDSGHCVIHYGKKTGDAVVIDSQMSTYYRFGLIVSESDGAVVRLAPTTKGPDRFSVITSTEFHFNALVGGGGAWPGGEAYNDKLNPKQRWIGTGLCLDARNGPIDGNKIALVEVVGCERGVHLIGNCTNNSLDVTLAHLCRTHLEIGDGKGSTHANRINAHCDSQGISPSIGVRMFGKDNLLTLSAAGMSPASDLVFEAGANGNVVIGLRLPQGVTDNSHAGSNRLMTSAPRGFIKPPAIPPSGSTLVHRELFPVEIRIVKAGKVASWTATDALGVRQTYPGPLAPGTSITLQPGDSIQLDYDEAPTWTFRSL